MLEVDIAEPSVEEDLARVQLEQEAKLGIVDHRVAAKIEERVVEVGQRFLEIAQEEVGDALLEVGDGEILIQPDGSLVALDLDQTSSARLPSKPGDDWDGATYGLLVLAERCVDHAHVEEDLGRVGHLLKLPQRLVELIVIVPAQGRNPRFYFLSWLLARRGATPGTATRPTCFNDMVPQWVAMPRAERPLSRRWKPSTGKTVDAATRMEARRQWPLRGPELRVGSRSRRLF